MRWAGVMKVETRDTEIRPDMRGREKMVKNVWRVEMRRKDGGRERKLAEIESCQVEKVRHTIYVIIPKIVEDSRTAIVVNPELDISYSINTRIHK